MIRSEHQGPQLGSDRSTETLLGSDRARLVLARKRLDRKPSLSTINAHLEGLQYEGMALLYEGVTKRKDVTATRSYRPRVS